MTREKSLKIWNDSVGLNEVECSRDIGEAIIYAFDYLRKTEPKEDINVTNDEMSTSEILERLAHLRYNCIASRDKMLIDEIELKLLKLKMIEEQEEK